MKRKKIFNFLLISFFVLVSFVSSFNLVFAGVDDPKPDPSKESVGKVIKLTNPLGDNTNDVPTLVEKLLEIVLQVGVPLVAIAIIYTGYLFVAAQGAPDKLTKAKQSLMYVLIGAGILLGAYAIAQALVSTVNAIRG